MDEQKKETIVFHYEKARNCATHHADGVLSNVTPNDDVFLAFFIERAPIPKSIEMELCPDGTLGDVVAAEGRDGLFREIQTGVVISKATAAVLIDRLCDLLNISETENGDEEAR